MTNEVALAPAPELIRYLSIVHRSLICIRQWATGGDRDAMLFGGWLADALHNVPTMLLYHNPQTSWNSPSRITGWLESGFPAQMRQYGAPEPLLAEYNQVLSLEGCATELGLKKGLGYELDLAPDAEMRRYLMMLSDAFLTLRGIGNNLPHHSEQIPWWPVLPQYWPEGADEDGRFNARFAGTLEPIPGALVCWGGFDAVQFRRTAEKAERLVPQRYRQYWRSCFGIIH